VNTDVVARTELRHRADGEPDRDVRIEIGRPYQATSGEWACPVSIHGLHPDLPAVRGEDSLQALALALDLVRKLLHQAVERGSSFQYPGTAEEVPVEAYFPGPTGA
jgi:hypothetical protein